jgi:superoxide dismutase
MKYLESDPVAEVHRIRAELMKEYGSFENWNKHLARERPRLEKEGWKFVTPEEMVLLRASDVKRSL